MELDRYRALVCAIETGSLSAAAEALQYTPSGVSRMVAALEEETGVPLLLREHSGVRPTKECEKLLPAIRDLLHAGESCAQLSAQLSGLDVGTVTVGTAYSAFYSPLARIISDFHARYGGTTRDAIDSYFENEQGKYVFIDTAGMRKKSKVDDVIERYSVLRATMAIDRADVCLIMIDAQEGVTEQDTKVAGLAHEAGKACIIVVNKWDLVEKDGKTMDKMSDDIRRDLSYMTYAPILFISAATGQRVPRLFEMINYVHNQSCMRISTGMLNNILADAQTRVQPPTDRGRRLKIYYMTQVGVCPPHFVVFCNERKLFHFSYQRYLENCIRNVFGLEGTPVIMSIREKGDKED